MTKYQRVESFIAGMIMLLSGVVMLFFPEEGSTELNIDSIQ